MVVYTGCTQFAQRHFCLPVSLQRKSVFALGKAQNIERSQKFDSSLVTAENIVTSGTSRVEAVSDTECPAEDSDEIDLSEADFSPRGSTDLSRNDCSSSPDHSLVPDRIDYDRFSKDLRCTGVKSPSMQVKVTKALRQRAIRKMPLKTQDQPPATDSGMLSVRGKGAMFTSGARKTAESFESSSNKPVKTGRWRPRPSSAARRFIKTDPASESVEKGELVVLCGARGRSISFDS